LKTIQSITPLPATGIRPGDYAIGSPESRAAARMMLENSQQLSQDEKDLLTIYNGGFEIPLSGYPVYQKGTVISDHLNGPVIPSHEDPVLKRSTTASIQFEHAFGREPKLGDVLRPEMLNLFYSPQVEQMRFKRFSTAWSRQNPQTECPIKFESGKRYGLRFGKWGCISKDPIHEWASLRWEALGRPTNWVFSPLIPEIPGIYFLGVVDGVHKMRAAIQVETENYIVPASGFVGRFVEMQKRHSAT
jgi:hypothetical protein